MRVLVGKMGKDSLKKLVTSLDASQIDVDIAVYAEKIYLSKHDLESIRIISEGAMGQCKIIANQISTAHYPIRSLDRAMIDK